MVMMTARHGNLHLQSSGWQLGVEEPFFSVHGLSVKRKGFACHLMPKHSKLFTNVRRGLTWCGRHKPNNILRRCTTWKLEHSELSYKCNVDTEYCWHGLCFAKRYADPKDTSAFSVYSSVCSLTSHLSLIAATLQRGEVTYSKLGLSPLGWLTLDAKLKLLWSS